MFDGIAVIACPHCGALATYLLWIPCARYVGLRMWTDGRRDGPLVPESPPTVVRCRDCEECFWRADGELIYPREDSTDWTGEIDPAWEAASCVQEPTEDQYYEAIRKGLAASVEQEIALRSLAWWLSNDPFRYAPDANTAKGGPAVGASRRNLEALAAILDDNDKKQRLTKAEVLRELGEFESAKEILSCVSLSDYTPGDYFVCDFHLLFNQLQELCSRRDAAVRELPLHGSELANQ